MDRQAVLDKAAQIKLVIFDVDGVLTDGGLILGESGDEYKIFHARDGHGLVMLRESGCQIAVITARSSKIVTERMSALGIKYVYQGQEDKGRALDDLLEKLDILATEAAYVGDDLMDLPAMARVGFSVAVADAHPVVIEMADWKTNQPGGHGAVREVCELIKQANGTLEDQFRRYLPS